MEKTVIAYYSATGNTLSLAKRIKDAELVDIVKVNEGKASIDQDTTRLGIFFPVYMGGVPYPVRKFIQETLAPRDNSNLGYIFSLITCGSSGKGAEWMIDRMLQEVGLGLSYGLSIKYPDCYLPLVRNIPNEEKTKEIMEKSEEKIKKALDETEKEEIRLPGKPLFGKIMMKMALKTGPGRKDEKMSVGENCIGCGTCASICPENNIVIKDGKAEINNKCLHCYACYNFCPQNAILYKGRSGQYKGLVETKELRRR